LQNTSSFLFSSIPDSLSHWWLGYHLHGEGQLSHLWLEETGFVALSFFPFSLRMRGYLFHCTNFTVRAPQKQGPHSTHQCLVSAQQGFSHLWSSLSKSLPTENSFNFCLL
jgi:hypothetical protein